MIDTQAYPEFTKIVDLVSSQNPLQAKRIQAFINSQDQDYLVFAEELSKILNLGLVKNENDRVGLAKAYSDLCMQILNEQIKFRKTGVYTNSDAGDIRQKVYNQPGEMRKYVIGLFITHMLWPNHYRLFKFFKKVLSGINPKNYLEVGAGHGMFVVESLKRFPDLKVTICDISKASIDISRQLLLAYKADLSKIGFICNDFLELPLEAGRFDFIVLGEVIEHVKDISGFMNKVRVFLEPKGRVYLSTCANCPAIDHLYHFHSVEEIRELIGVSGFSIKEEIALPAEDLPAAALKEQLITINYAAELTYG